MLGDSTPLLAPTLGERLATVQEGVAGALSEAGRTGSSTTLIVITKFHPVSLIRGLVELGVRDFGESRHQEAQLKSDELAGSGLRWHFIGQLQSKKARAVSRYARVIHSVDRIALIDALLPSAPDDAPLSPPIDVFLQVDLSASADQDGSRGGAAAADLERLTERIVANSNLRLLGVMAVAPLGEPPRPAFARLRSLSESMTRIAPSATDISAGMSGDYREALLEGATHLRIGSAITGSRPGAE